MRGSGYSVPTGLGSVGDPEATNIPCLRHLKIDIYLFQTPPPNEGGGREGVLNRLMFFPKLEFGNERLKIGSSIVFLPSASGRVGWGHFCEAEVTSFYRHI